MDRARGPMGGMPFLTINDENVAAALLIILIPPHPNHTTADFPRRTTVPMIPNDNKDNAAMMEWRRI